MALLSDVLKRSAAAKSEFSHIITIFQKPSFLADAQAKGAPEFMSMAKKSIGAYWQQSTAKVIGSGLSLPEQELLMPPLVDCEPSDRNFRAKVSDYFNHLRLTIPYKDGKKLEIGLQKSKDPFALAADNLPLNPAEYLLYRWALTHPEVAENRTLAEANMLVVYYIFDADSEEIGQVSADKIKDTALEYYLTLRDDTRYLNMVLTMMKVDPRAFKGPNAGALKLAKAKELSSNKAEEFIKVFDDKLLEQRYIINTLINLKILKLAGKIVINEETGETLGHNENEAVAWLKDPLNSQSVAFLMARMQEAIGESVLQKAATAVKEEQKLPTKD